MYGPAYRAERKIPKDTEAEVLRKPGSGDGRRYMKAAPYIERKKNNVLYTCYALAAANHRPAGPRNPDVLRTAIYALSCCCAEA